MTSKTAVRIAAKFDMREFDVVLDDRGRVTRPCFKLPGPRPDFGSEIVDREHYELCVALVAHGFLDTKAQRKHYMQSCPEGLKAQLYDDIVDALMDIARRLARLDKLTSDVRCYPAAVRKCVDEGVTPSACTELVLRTLTLEEISTYFADC